MKMAVFFVSFWSIMTARSFIINKKVTSIVRGSLDTYGTETFILRIKQMKLFER